MKKASLILFAVLLVLFVSVSCNKATKESGTPVSTQPVQTVEKDTSFTITFNANGGTGTMAPMKVKGSTSCPENKFTGPEGFVFVSWNTKSDGTGVSYTQESVVTSDKDMLLYAMWQPEFYGIQIGEPLVKGGVVSSSAQIYRISELDQLSTLVLEEVYPGYSFVSYGNDPDGRVKGYDNVWVFGDASTSYALLTIPTGNIGEVVIVPEFRAHTYEVVYNANGGNGAQIANTAHTYGEDKALATNTYTNDLYTFYGWNTEADGSGTHYKDGEVVRNLTTEDKAVINLYAEWLSFVKINLHANDGEGDTVTTVQIPSGVPYDLPLNSFIRDGYAFCGWGAGEGDDEPVVYEDGAPIESEEEVELYAIWKPIDYTITFAEVEGGSAVVAPAGYNVSKEEQTAKLTASEDAGYKIAAWAVEGNDKAYVSDSTVVIPAGTFGDFEIVPEFTKIVYSIAFAEVEGGSAASSASSYTVSKDDQHIALTAVDGDGFAIEAWAVNGNDKAYVEGSTLIIPAGSVGDIEVVPNFGTIPYDIIFAETKEGTVSSEVSTYRVSDSVQIIKVTPEPADGYVIDSWQIGGNKSASISGSVLIIPAGTTGDINVTPLFKEVTYKVIYDKNADDATGTMESTTHEYFTASALNANAFHRNGYAFDGWNTKADGSGKSISDMEKVEGLTNNSVITLYAQWKALVGFTVDSSIFEDCEVLETYYTYAPQLDRKYIMVANGPIYDANNNVISTELEIPASNVENPYSAYNGGEGFLLDDALHFYHDEGTTVTVIYMHSPVWVLKKY